MTIDRYQNVLESNVFMARGFLDKYDNFNLVQGHKYYKKYMEDKAECPTRAKVAKQHIKNILGKEYYTSAFKHNKKLLETYPDIDLLVKEVESKESLSPKTLNLRNKLIKLNRIDLYTVKPKLTGLDKLLLKLKVMF